MNVHIPDHIRAIKKYDSGKTISQLKEELGWEKTAILWNKENTLGVSKKAMAAVHEVSDRVNYYPDPTGFVLRED